MPNANSEPLYSVRFPDLNTGYAAGAYGTILKTIDGGSTWITLSSGTLKMLYSVYFTDANTGYIVGDVGTILTTTDGGLSWTTCVSGNSNLLTSVWATDANTAYAVGQDGTILKTINGGTNWFELYSGTHNNLNSVCFTDFNTGYVVGEGGTILATTDGGTDFIPGGSLTPAQFNIYPDPAENSITIESSGTFKKSSGSVSVSSINGQELINQMTSGSKSVINISTLPAGIYIIKYLSQGFTKTVKFVKE